MTSMPLEIWLLSHTRRNADVAHSLLQTLNKVPVGIHLQRPGMMEYDDRQEALLRALQQRVGQQVQMLKHLMILVSTATTTVPQERDPSVHWWPASTRACPAALKVYFKYNECLPSRIVVYRDGVGDCVLLSVVDYEVPQFTQSIKAMGEDSAPKLTVLVMKKRISSRFFAD